MTGTSFVRLHRNAQRLPRTILVVNPFAESLSFADGRTRARRDHAKLLTLVRAIALLHQHQREMKLVEHEGERIEYIEATAADVELATKLLADVLDIDELPPVTRNVLAAIEVFVTEKATAANVPVSEVRFTRRELREHTGLGHTQMRAHLRRLEELEHVRVHRENKTFLLSLPYDADAAGRAAIVRGSGGHLAGPEPARAGLRDADANEGMDGIRRVEQDRVNGVAEKNASYRT